MRRIRIEFNNTFIDYLNDENYFHREEGPAIECIAGPYKGYKIWYCNGLIHNENSFAVVNAFEKDYYYFNNKRYPFINNDDDWIKFVKVLKVLG